MKQFIKSIRNIIGFGAILSMPMVALAGAQNPIDAAFLPTSGLPAQTYLDQTYTVTYHLKNNLIAPEPLKQIVSTTTGSGFAIQDLCSHTKLAVKGICTITINFKPVNYGVASVQLTLNYDNNVVPLPALSTTVLPPIIPIEWSPCTKAPTFDCGTLTVPMDYQDASVGTIQLPVAIHHATQNKLGTLFTNFGGPWGDNIGAMQRFFTHTTAIVKNNYDVVTFTPRGVAPNAINCLSDEIDAVNELQREINLLAMNSSLTAAMVYDKTAQQRQLCTYSPLEKYASTKNTVQDMDLFRQALQLDKIDYLGYSYGSRLGLAYLLQYAPYVDKMILDSNAAPDNDFAAFVTSFSDSTENVLNQFFEFCVAAGPSHCALYQNTREQIKQEYVDLVSRAVVLGGIPTSATYNYRPFTAAMLNYTTMSLLAAPSAWTPLAEALQQVITMNNADILMEIYIELTNYMPATNTFMSDNSVIGSAVLCKDYTVPDSYQNQSGWVANVQALMQTNPILGGSVAKLLTSFCIAWPQTNAPLLPEDLTSITNATPIVLIINDRYDSHEPVASAQAVSAYLTNRNVTNKLLIWNGVGHMSYSYSAPTGGCIDTNVDNFLKTGQLPAIDVCDDDTNPFLYNYGDKDQTLLKWINQL